MTLISKIHKIHLYIINLRKDVLYMKDRYLTVKDVAEMLKISYDTALNFVKNNVDSVCVGRQYRVLESKLNEVLYPPKSVKRSLKMRPVYNIIERT